MLISFSQAVTQHENQFELGLLSQDDGQLSRWLEYVLC